MIIETRTNNIVPKVIFNGSEKVYFKSIHERIIDYTRLGWDVAWKGETVIFSMQANKIYWLIHKYNKYEKAN